MNKLVFIVLLSLGYNFVNGQNHTDYEQIAVDYFFAEIFNKEFGTVKAIGFSGKTDSVRHSYSIGVMFRCEQWSQTEKEQFLEDYPIEVKDINISQFGFKIKNTKGRMNKLVINILPAFKTNNRAYTLISIYKKLHFVEYFLIETNLKGEILSYCKQGQII